jgi:hypothetical protein
LLKGLKVAPGFGTGPHMTKPEPATRALLGLPAAGVGVGK